MKIDDIVDAIHKSLVRISDHADEEAEADELTFDEIYFSVLHGEIIEDYPDDKPYPSCLLYGMSFSGDPVPSVGVIMKKTNGRYWLPCIGLIRIDGLMGVRGKEHDAV